MPESVVAAAVGYDELTMLRLVTLGGGRSGPVKLSYSGVANRLDVSSQTTSRWSQCLEEADFIDHEVISDDQWITITDAGESALRQEYANYRCIFETPSMVVLRGQVTGGIGGGRRYISLSGHMKQFEDRLDYEPFPNTLSVRPDDDTAHARARMTALNAVPIDGWEDDRRTFGPMACYVASITVDDDSHELIHVIVPKRTHHSESQLEIIAPDKLHDRFDLDDGDAVAIRVEEAEYE